ncbi:hypothetical protein [Sphaerisporangium dianthi]|uniref:Uncharacterized protein n=1 Tax=Sphaerisporangium dianthi TaxID=1436120 RepID=A0ABV9CFG7_9ACTN
MNHDLCLDVPADFDDSDADSQVHPIARLMFHGRTNADAFGQAQEWVSAHEVFLVDTSWHHEDNEEFPFVLSIFFRFENEPEDD